VLFGLFARQTAGQDSDVDLLVVGHYRGQALIVDIQGGRRGIAEIGRIIDGKIIKNHG
jgi:predicted nucleotidyltransferase